MVYLIAHRIPSVYLPTYTLIPIVYILALVTQLHFFNSASSTLPSRRIFPYIFTSTFIWFMLYRT